MHICGIYDIGTDELICSAAVKTQKKRMGM